MFSSAPVTVLAGGDRARPTGIIELGLRDDCSVLKLGEGPNLDGFIPDVLGAVSVVSRGRGPEGGGLGGGKS